MALDRVIKTTGLKDLMTKTENAIDREQFPITYTMIEDILYQIENIAEFTREYMAHNYPTKTHPENG